MQGALINKIDAMREKVNSFAGAAVMRNPMNYIEERRMSLDRVVAQLLKNAGGVISLKRASFIRLASTLDAISPLKVLGRGYAIATDKNGCIVKNAAELSVGERLNLKLNEGAAACVVDSIVSDRKGYKNDGYEF